ncbi:hypothetical protein B296_00015907 [Ensete ventricosum]|uniref:Uncharacterized protein n=1 Tax=Ensete ventricosum TaxID=4639 RepID=A0A427A130_ENSVE|nr:hypothetical protein B296_00015907 [Ensete ventricosum]
MRMLGSGCHFGAGLSSDLVEMFLQDKTFARVVGPRGAGSGRLVSRPCPSTSIRLGPRHPIWEGDHVIRFALGLSACLRDSVSVVVVLSSNVPGDSGTADALVAMQSFFNVDSTVTTRRLVEMFNLDKMNSGGGAGSGSTAPSAASTPIAGDAGVSTAKKRPSSGVGAGLMKCLRKVVTEQHAYASGSTARTSVDKSKGIVELEEVPERGYTMWELCEVEDRAGADKYFAFIMMRLSQHEKILTLRVANKELKVGVDQELVTVAERRAKELDDEVEKMWTELESLRSQRRELEQEVGLLHSSLDGARNDRARLEGDVLSLTKAIAFLESSLEKIRRVTYEFEYWVALERLRGKHLEITIERDPFAECPEDANVKMDLDQPFDDGTPSEKQPTL